METVYVCGPKPTLHWLLPRQQRTAVGSIGPPKSTGGEGLLEKIVLRGNGRERKDREVVANDTPEHVLNPGRSGIGCRRCIVQCSSGGSSSSRFTPGHALLDGVASLGS